MLNEEGKIEIPWDDKEFIGKLMEEAGKIGDKLVAWQRENPDEFAKVCDRSTGTLLCVTASISEVNPLYSIMLATNPDGFTAEMSCFFMAGYISGKLGLMDSPTVPSAILKAFET